MSLLIVILVAISLSMDAFSLSLAYGTLDLEKKSINLLSLIVGSYHFIMPLLGMWFGNKLITILPEELFSTLSILKYWPALSNNSPSPLPKRDNFITSANWIVSSHFILHSAFNLSAIDIEKRERQS